PASQGRLRERRRGWGIVHPGLARTVEPLTPRCFRRRILPYWTRPIVHWQGDSSSREAPHVDSRRRTGIERSVPGQPGPQGVREDSAGAARRADEAHARGGRGAAPLVPARRRTGNRSRHALPFDRTARSDRLPPLRDTASEQRPEAAAGAVHAGLRCTRSAAAFVGRGEVALGLLGAEPARE